MMTNLKLFLLINQELCLISTATCSQLNGMVMLSRRGSITPLSNTRHLLRCSHRHIQLLNSSSNKSNINKFALVLRCCNALCASNVVRQQATKQKNCFFYLFVKCANAERGASQKRSELNTNTAVNLLVYTEHIKRASSAKRAKPVERPVLLAKGGVHVDMRRYSLSKRSEAKFIPSVKCC
jgi:hypothetical protein